MNAQASSPTASRWLARLDLEILRDGERVRLGRRQHLGPLRIQRPFFPEGPAPLHLYLLHPPGGLVGGDVLDINVDVRENASTLLTTPAAQKLYRSAGQTSQQTVELRVAVGAELEWLPTETIVFDGALAQQTTRVFLEPGAGFIGWEMGGFGRPASGIAFETGALNQNFELYRASEPRLIERIQVCGGSELLDAAYGYAGQRAYGTLVAAPADEARAGELVELVRQHIVEIAGLSCAVTAVDGIVVVRALARGLELIRPALVRSWETLRPAMFARRATPPRIWAT